MSRPVQLPLPLFLLAVVTSISFEEQETDAPLLSLWPRLQYYSSTVAFRK